MQAMLQIATAHGASLDQRLPLNTAYICWQVARHEQLACILSMLGGVLGMPSLQSGFMAALAQLGNASSAATLPVLIEVRMTLWVQASHKHSVMLLAVVGSVLTSCSPPSLMLPPYPMAAGRLIWLAMIMLAVIRVLLKVFW